MIIPKLPYNFKHPKLLLGALNHPSLNQKENPYEKLEYLGDSILNAAITTILYQKYDNSSEASLSRIRANLINTKSLAEVAHSINLSDFIQAAKGTLVHGKFSDKMLENTMEALIGAIFIDSNFNFQDTLEIIHTLWYDLLNNQDLDAIDAKTSLQQYSQKAKGVLPIYTLVSKSGFDHSPIFCVRVEVVGIGMAEGTAPILKKAEEEAASALINKIELLKKK